MPQVSLTLKLPPEPPPSDDADRLSKLNGQIELRVEQSGSRDAVVWPKSKDRLRDYQVEGVLRLLLAVQEAREGHPQQQESSVVELTSLASGPYAVFGAKITDTLKHCGKAKQNSNSLTRALAKGQGFSVSISGGRPSISVDKDVSVAVLIDGRAASTQDMRRWLDAALHPAGDTTAIPHLRAGSLDTRTQVLYVPVMGALAPSSVVLRRVPDEKRLPDDIEQLVDLAYESFIFKDTDRPKGIRHLPDQRYLAPVGFVANDGHDLDDLGEHRFELEESSFRAFLAFAASDGLVERDKRFARLRGLVSETSDARQPVVATLSLGVRVLVQTSDQHLLVCSRTSLPKINPECWSVSANEGVRLHAYEEFIRVAGHPPRLDVYVKRALGGELGPYGLDWTGQVPRSFVLSVYQNSYAQWGVGVLVLADETAEQLRDRLVEVSRLNIKDPKKPKHFWEHGGFDLLPAGSEEIFLRAVQERQRAEPDRFWSRWYGGAFETFASYFRWKQLDLEFDQNLSAIEGVEAAMIRLWRAANQLGLSLQLVDSVNSKIFRK